MAVVSVIVPCYNHARFVRACLDSVLAQTFPDWALIVVDDASTDGTRAEIERWLSEHDLDATLIANDQNEGIGAVLNLALGQARASYVAILSGDDVWEPHKLEVQVAALDASDEHVALIYSDAAGIDEEGRVFRRSLLSEGGVISPREAPRGEVFAAFLTRNYIATVTPLIRASAIEAVGGYDESLACEDWDMWLRLSARYEFAFSDYPAGRRRFHENAAGSNRDRSVAMWRSHVATLEKWLGTSPLYDRFIGERVSFYAWLLYRATGDPENVVHLRLAAKSCRRPRAIARLLVARCRVSPNVIARLARMKTAIEAGSGRRG